MSKTSRPLSQEQVLKMKIKLSREKWKERIYNWFIIVLLVGMVAFVISQVIVHHF